VKRAIGLWLYVSLQMQHHYLFQISLRSWLWVLVVLPPAVALVRRLRWTDAILTSTVGALLLLGIEWSRRKGYVFFEPISWDIGGEPTPIGVDEQVPCRASGFFAVGGNERHLVNVPAYLSYVQTQEHIVMARLERTRFLLVARSPRAQVGFWYAFFQPHDVIAVETGRVYWGLQHQASLAIRYRCVDEQAPQQRTLYLTFSNTDAMPRVRYHLVRASQSRFSKTIS
jgi:hypothetical protein